MSDGARCDTQKELGSADRVHGEQIKHNNDKWRAKTQKLRDRRGFRIPKGTEETWQRIDAPRFDGTVHQVVSFKGANVKDEKGQSYPVKNLLPVPAGSQDVDIGGIEYPHVEEPEDKYAADLEHDEILG